MKNKRSSTSKKRQARRSRLPKIVSIVGVVLAGIVVVYFVVFWLAQPPRPGKFYNTPKDLPTEQGVLLRNESIKTTVDNADAYRILYSSRDIDNLPIAVSGIVLVPQTEPPEGGFPVVAWAHGTSGIERECALSLFDQTATEFAQAAPGLVADGYVVVATDYPGLGTEGPHPYLIGRSEAQAVLDGVRTVTKQDDWNGSKHFALWGHSQGGHAVLFASQYASGYAPELELVGTAAVAPATELTALLRDDIHSPVGKVFGSYALKSWSQLFPGAHLDKIVKPADLPFAEIIAKGCIGTKNQGLVILPEVELMSRDFLQSDPTTTEPWASIIQQNSVPTSGISTPVAVLQGSDDTVIHPPVSRSWAAGFCAHNSMLTYKEYAGKDHISVFPASLGDARAWIKDRFAGQPVASDCAELPGA